METFLIKAAQLILAFVILVTVHEFGHYLFARIFGMRVERFYLFFNPWFSILKYRPDLNTLQFIAWTRKDKDGKEQDKALATVKLGKEHPAYKNGKPTWRATLYGLGWVPLGGYCSIGGMIDETTDSASLAKEPESWEFRAKKPFPRLLVMLAGVIFNFILAIIIYIGIACHWGDSYIPFERATEGMDFHEQLHKVGFRDGDILLTVNGEKAMPNDNSLQWRLINGATVTVLRDHKDTVTVVVPDGYVTNFVDADKETSPVMYRVPVMVSKPVSGEPAEKAGILAGDRIVKVANDTTPALTEFHKALDARIGQTVPMTILRDGNEIQVECAVNQGPAGNGVIGIQLTDPRQIFQVEHIDYSIWQSIPKGISDGTERLVTYVSSLKLLFTKQGAQSVGGFGAIGDLYPDKWDWYSFWNITAFLSVILAFMNVLPIPALDGGHVVLTLWEIITRRKPSIKVLEYAQMAGMAFLFLLLIYANANDIYRFFIK